MMAGRDSLITNVCLTPDGRRAVCGSYDNTLLVWDLESGKCLHVLKPKGEIKIDSLVQLSDDGHRVACSSNISSPRYGAEGTTLEVWDLDNGARLHVLELAHVVDLAEDYR
jgi:WD40 repeat protein